MKHEIGPEGQISELSDRSRWIALYVLWGTVKEG